MNTKKLRKKILREFSLSETYLSGTNCEASARFGDLCYNIGMNSVIPKQIALRDQLVTYYPWHDGGKAMPTLLFLHGWRSEGRVWEQVIAQLVGKDFSLIGVDLPGFGKSEIPKKAFSISDYADIVLDLIKKLDLQNVILVGHSFGGRIAIKLASENSHFSKVVLVDSGGFKTSHTLKKVLAKVVKPLFAPDFMKPLRARIYKKMGAEDYVVLPEMQKTFSAVIGEDLSLCLPRIKIPTLILWGENDFDTPVSFAERLHFGIVGSELHVIKNAGHYSFLDQPKEFCDRLTSFLS